MFRVVTAKQLWFIPCGALIRATMVVCLVPAPNDMGFLRVHYCERIYYNLYPQVIEVPEVPLKFPECDFFLAVHKEDWYFCAESIIYLQPRGTSR